MNKSLTILFLFLIVIFPVSSQAGTNTITVAAVQLDTAHAGNFEKIRELVKEAKARGADLVVFPEESVFSWLNPIVFLEAVPIPGKHSDGFAAIARDESIWIAAGLGEQGPEANDGALEYAHQAYNAGVLISPTGEIVLHHRQVQVVQNAFDPEACMQILNQPQCSYTPGNLSDITAIDTPFGKTAILVCSDAFVYPSH
ncbi:MAG: carbon-nitrogen hydrolase family protein [Parachlamydiaceae bacterium]